MAVGRAIDKVNVEVMNSSPEVVLQRFDELEHSLLQEERSPDEQLEIRRRIVESTISNLSGMKGAGSAMDSSWRRMESLGFSNRECEASMLFFRARFLVKFGDSGDAASDALGRLLQLAEAFRGDELDSIADHFADAHARLFPKFRDRFEGSSGGG